MPVRAQCNQRQHDHASRRSGLLLTAADCVFAVSCQSLVSRCRTYGDAVHEISVSYKTLLKELQREHTTGRDVLLSLKTTGLLR